MPDSKTKETSATKAADGVGAAFNVVPSLYYDLIARVCPGLGFWLVLIIPATCNAPSSWSVACFAELESVSLLILIITSYIAGMVGTGFCIVWDWLTMLALLKMPGVALSVGLNEEDTIFQQWRRIAEKMEAIAKTNDEAGRIVSKALAEVSLCQNLLTGLLAAILIGVASKGKLFFLPEASSEWAMLLLLTFALFLAVLFRQAMFLGRVDAIYIMYVNPKDMQRAS
jgi:hypothetical protein